MQSTFSGRERRQGDSGASSAENALRPEIQPDMYGGKPVFSGDVMEDDAAGAVLASVMTGDTAPGTTDALPASVTHFAVRRDDIEHLQNEAFRLAWNRLNQPVVLKRLPWTGKATCLPVSGQQWRNVLL